ncbi:uncharacterized protein cubi_02322 [Cryptosporidium ubiquitum]|uniref:Uncharacterized protein n=1 Tax=Cryptosporidium ubiquitum TaxID=857276 RepID=A0A1J4MI09_9CRYT|nr:uncharacterized protein cubi_02322 [Cryptosporidium ubiquitum]OII73091.1 hypothetical protein cubi_02322 [Cryptosporidium ubiquitum]
MNIEQLCNYDLLLSFETESKKLLAFFKDDINNDDPKLNTCKLIANIGVEILDRYYRIIHSTSFLRESSFLNRNSFIEALDGRITNVLKVCRFCIEFLIYQDENIVRKKYSDNKEDKDVLFELLCKVLFYQGDFLECSVILGRILGDCSEEDIFNQKIKIKFRYLFEFFSSWNLLNAKETPFNNINNNMFGDIILKELKLRSLCSVILDENNHCKNDQTSYAEIVNEIQHSFVKFYKEISIKDKTFSKKMIQDQFSTILENILIRLECCKKYQKKYLDNKRFALMNDLSLEKNYMKSIKLFSSILNQDNTRNNIFKYLEEIMLLFGINNFEISCDPFQSLQNYLSDLSMKLNISNSRNESKVTTDRITRSRNNINNEFSNFNLNKEAIEYDLVFKLENPLKQIIIDIYNNTLIFPKYNDKQYKIWIQTIPYYCYNLILSILKKKEMKCDDIFSLNLNSNFPSIEQFDEMIIKETNLVTEHYATMIETKSVSFQDIELFFNRLRHDFCDSFNGKHICEAVDNKIQFLSTNLLPLIDEFLINFNILLNKILKFIFSTPNKDTIVFDEEIYTLFFNLIEGLFKYCTRIIKNVVYYEESYRNMNNRSTIRFEYLIDGLESYDENNSWIEVTNSLYYLLFKVNEPVQKDILFLFYNIMKTLVIFIFVTKNILNIESRQIILFYNGLRSKFLCLMDTFSLIKEKFDNNIITEIDLLTKKLLILFKVFEIPIVEIYLDNGFLLLLKEDLMKICKYIEQINLIINLSVDFLGHKEINNNFLIGHALTLFSNKSIQIIKDKFMNWKNIFYSKLKNDFSSDFMIYSTFLENNYFEHLKMKKINCMKNELIDQIFLQHIDNIVSDVYLFVVFEKYELSESFYGFLVSLMKTLIIIINEDVRYLYFNGIIINSIISNITKLLIKFTEIYEFNSIILNELFEETLYNLLFESILINVTCIHKIFMNHLSANKLNLLIMKNLMNLLIVLFDFFKYSCSIKEISSNSIINLIRYLTYLEFSFEFFKDESREIKDIKIFKNSEDEIYKKHILNNYCITIPIIEQTCDFEFLNISEIDEAKLSQKFDKFLNSVLNTKILLLSTTIKFALFSNLSTIENWFKETLVFVEKYEVNNYLMNWNSLYYECKKIVQRYSTVNKSLNMRNLYPKNKLDENHLSPEQETEYLELLGIQFQLLYGIPVCPLPSMPFNKMPIYNQALVYDFLLNLNNFVSNSTNFKNLFINWLIHKITNTQKVQTTEILEYISPYSPLIAMCCNIFHTLINCTSLTEKQYSDSKIKFYTSIIGLIEILYFNGSFIDSETNENIWNIISSPLIYPLFMDNLYKVLNHEKNNYHDIFKQNLENGFSSILYNSHVSDQILNFYDNIMVLSPSFLHFEINSSKMDKHGFDELLFDDISMYFKENKLTMVSLEPLLYCKYYYAFLLDKLIRSNMDVKFLNEKYSDKTLIQIQKKAGDFVSFSNQDSIFLKINWKNIKKYIPFKFLKDCFISCIPISYVDRSSSLWNPGRFGATGNNNIQPSLNTLFKYLRWLNINLFLIDNYDINIVTCCNNILKQIICEFDDYNTFENLENEYPILLKRIIAQLIYLLECEIKYFIKLENDIQMPYSQIVNNILSVAFDQIIIRYINIKGVYKKTNTKYLIIYLNKNKILSKYRCYNKIVPKNYENSLIINSIEVISRLRKSLFTEFIPKVSTQNKKWYSIYANSFSQIHNCIWLPSLLESKTRFKLAKILISSFLFNSEKNQDDLKRAIIELKNAYSLSVESLVICHLILSGDEDEVEIFFKSYEKNSQKNELINFFNSKLLIIYGIFFNIYLNKFPEKNPLGNKIGFLRTQINDATKNINISYSNLSSNLASILFYFYKSFINYQSIKQFIIIFITNNSIPLLNDDITEFKNLIKINSHSVYEYNIKEMLNELIFDELNSSQTILKKNKLIQSIFTPIISQSFSHFSLINFILLEEDSKNLLSYYQKFLLNKKVMNFWGFETNKFINDHYNGLYLRRNRKYLCNRYKFMLIPSILILVIKNEIITNIKNLLANCINSETKLYNCFNRDQLMYSYDNFPIFFTIYNLLLETKSNNFSNISDISYHYLGSFNLILDYLIDVLIGEFKSIRQLPAVEKFEYFISDQIKNYSKKNITTSLIDIGVINWNDISESGHFNISLNAIIKTLNNILELFDFVDNIGLPIDGKLFSYLFGLVIIFHKYEIVYSENDNSQINNEFVQCIPLNTIKQLERQLGNFVLNNIPFSIIPRIGEFKLLFKNIFINIFNKCFVFSIDNKIEYNKNYFFEVFNLIIQFLGVSSNGVNAVNLTSKNNEGIESISLYEMKPELKRIRYDISLFEES